MPPLPLDSAVQLLEKALRWHRGGVVTQRIANPRTPVRFRAMPPTDVQSISKASIMTDFVQARSKMVDNQVRTSDVTDHALLSAMLEVPREAFVPAERAEFAYIDEDIALDPIGPANRYMMEPAQFARLAQLAQIEKDDIILVVGAGTGYAAAVLSMLCGSVVAIEEDPGLAEFAEAALLKLEYDNVAFLQGEHRLGFPKEGPYDVIFFNGAVDYVPEDIQQQIQEGGRLVAVEGTGNSGVAKVYRKERDIVSVRETMNCAIKPLPGFQREAGFVF